MFRQDGLNPNTPEAGLGSDDGDYYGDSAVDESHLTLDSTKAAKSGIMKG